MKKKKVVIAGATGFIGRWFIHRFQDKYHIIALSRKEINDPQYPKVEWRKADLYSLSSTTQALQGADYALYLVHSMQPSTRLNQGSFDDTDLLLADNFARSAEACNLKHIVFVGGILPKETDQFSRHLRSRYETEQTLGSRNVPLTSLRAGIIIGPGGSSFNIVKHLVRRLPIMACPKWCKSPSQPIDIEDMLHAIDQVTGNTRTFGKAIEVGGKEAITYMDILQRTSKLMGKKRVIFSIPFFTLGFSKLWVALFSSSNTTFVSPLIESLKHDMRISDDQHILFKPEISIDESIRKALNDSAPRINSGIVVEKQRNTVRSVQRLANPTNKPTTWIADTYPSWLSRSFSFFIKVARKDRLVRIYFFGILLLQLEYMPERSDEKRRLFFITDGVLTKSSDTGWLEFRSVLDNRHIIAALHRFVPALPWIVYRNTQAIFHLFVMKRFNRFLKKVN